MPEGHLIHRYARDQQEALVGREVRLSSPQGRLDVSPFLGRSLTAVEAYGKHLLYHFDSGPALHVHLGMRGLFLRHEDPSVAPRPSVRLRLVNDMVAYDLIAPVRCEPLPAFDEEALRASLGPDPLRDDADPEEAVRRLIQARRSVGVTLLDQAVWAGLGNAWRSELLFLAAMDPNARHIEAGAARHLWDLAVRHLSLGRDAGQVVSDPAAPDERWVYKRTACRSCGASVRSWQLGGRTVYACPVEQPQ